MYRIALCDDEAAELNKTEEMLARYRGHNCRAEFKVERFASADALLNAVRGEGYAPDLLLLDIYMPEKMGIEAAAELRKMGNKSRIIFLTASREHALAAFEVDAVQYLVKPVSDERLFLILDKFLADLEEERGRYLVLRVGGHIRRVAVNEIVYCEAAGKTQCLHLAGGMECVVRMTMAELYAMLARYQEFVRVGVAYIINLDHIDKLNCQEICLNSGEKIYLPRGAYKTLKEQYFDYYCGEGER